MRLQTHCSTFVVFLDIHHEHPHVGFASANLVKLIYFPPFLIKFMDQAKAKRDQDRPQRSETAPGPHRDRAGTAQTWRRLEGTRRNSKGHARGTRTTCPLRGALGAARESQVGGYAQCTAPGGLALGHLQCHVHACANACLCVRFPFASP